jgi:replicative DNA helicase
VNQELQSPHAPDSERAIIGALLLEPAEIARVRERLKPECFYLDSHRKPYEALLALHARDAALDPLQLNEELRARGTLDKIGGLSTLRKSG